MRLARIWTLFKNTLTAIGRGELLLRLNAGKYLPHILYTFFIFGIIIWISVKTDDSINQMERNQATIKELRQENAKLRYKMARTASRSAVLDRLGKKKSALGEPEVKATILEK
ncbi:MAG: hypothetical protein J5764_02710 [Bacteroidales bacterium]|nr:hypothetical protein [Bacteroidales bacterium]